MRNIDFTKFVRIARYPVLFTVMFFVFLVIQFPVDRFAPMVERQLSSALGREVHIGELSMSLTGSVNLEDVKVAIPMPENSGTAGVSEEDDEGDITDDDGKKKGPKKPRTLFYTIEEISLNVGYIALIFGELNADLELELFDGAIEISYSGPLPSSQPQKKAPKPRRPLKKPEADEEEPVEDDSQTPINISLSVEHLSLVQILELKNKLPLPLTGEISLNTELSSETGQFSDLNGEVNLDIANLIAGKAGGQIDVGGMPMTIDPIAVESLKMEIDVEKGVGDISTFVTRSRDFDLKVEGSLNFADPVERSRFDVYIMFKILDGYTQKSDTSKLLVSNLEEFSRDIKRAKRDDDYYGFKYRGMMQTIGSARFSPSKTSGKERPGRSKQRKSRKDRKSKPRTSRDRADRKPPASTTGTPPQGLLPPGKATRPEAGPKPFGPAPNAGAPEAGPPTMGGRPGPTPPELEIEEGGEEEAEEVQEVVESESEEASPEAEGEAEGEETQESPPEEEGAEEEE